MRMNSAVWSGGCGYSVWRTEKSVQGLEQGWDKTVEGLEGQNDL